MSNRTAAGWLGLSRPWPPAVRALVGGAAGWAAIRWGVTEPVPTWARGGAAGVSAVGGLAAPAVTQSATPVVITGWAAASSLGLYLGVPETDHVVGVGAVLTVLVVASLAGPRRLEWVLVVGLDVVLCWAAVRGAPAGGPALVAGFATLGLLVLAPVTTVVPGPSRPLVPHTGQAAALIGLQGVFAVVLARQSATADTIALAAIIAGVALIVLVVAARLAVGPNR